MRRFNVLKAIFILSAAAFLSSCAQLFNIDASGDEAVLTVSVNNSSARTINPAIDSTVLSDITLYKGSASEDNSVASWTDITAMGNASLRFLPDTYTFILTAKAGGASLSSSPVTVDLTAGNNSVSFVLSVTSYGTASETATGSVDITVTYPGTSAPAGTSIELVSMDMYGLSMSAEGESEVVGDNTVVTFSGSEIPAGVYRVRVTVVADGQNYVSYSDIIRVAEGLTSRGSYTCSEFIKNGNITNLSYYTYEEDESDVILYYKRMSLSELNAEDYFVSGDSVTFEIDGIALTDLNNVYVRPYADSSLDGYWKVLGDEEKLEETVYAGEHFNFTGTLLLSETPASTDLSHMGIEIRCDGLEGETTASHSDALGFVGYSDFEFDSSNRASTVTVTFDADNDTENVTKEVYPGQYVALIDEPSNSESFFCGWYNGDTKVEGGFIAEDDVTITAKYETSHDFTNGTAIEGSDDTEASNCLVISNDYLSNYSNAVLTIKVCHEKTVEEISEEGSWAGITDSSWAKKYLWQNYELKSAAYEEELNIKISDLLTYLDGDDLLFHMEADWSIEECKLSFTTPESYYEWVKLTLELNGGTISNEARTYFVKGSSPNIYDADDGIKCEPVKDGYIFVAWKLQKDVELNENTYETNYAMMQELTEDTTLYAVWSPKCVLSFNSNGGSAVSSMDYPSTYTDLYMMMLRAIVSEDAYNQFNAKYNNPVSEKEGYVLINWYADEAFTVPMYQLLASGTGLPAEQTLYAKWGQECKLNFVDGTSTSSTTVISGCTYYITVSSSTYSLSSNDSGSGYGSSIRSSYGKTFAGWYTDEECTTQFPSTSEAAVEITGDTTVYAKWTDAEMCTVTLKDGENTLGTISVEKNDTYYITDYYDGYQFNTYKGFEDEDSLNVTEEGYELEGWYTDANCTENCVENGPVTITEDITLYSKSYKLCTISLYIGDEVYKELYVKSGSKVNIQENISDYFRVYVNYEGSDDSNDYSEPTEDGKVFVRWYQDSEFSEMVPNTATTAMEITEDTSFYGKMLNTYTVSLYDGETLFTTVTLTEGEYSLNLNSVEGYYVFCNCSEVLLLYSFNPPTKDNYTLDGWYTDAECTTQFPTSESNAVKINGDTTLYAKWTETAAE